MPINLPFARNIGSKAILSIFNNKGVLASVGEKAILNFQNKYIKPNEKKNYFPVQNKLHYFAIGHSFKQLDAQTVFRLNEKHGVKVATQFTSLQRQNFNFDYRKPNQDNKELPPNQLFELLNAIRNMNAHYIYRLENIQVGEHDLFSDSYALRSIQQNKTELSPSLVDFICESFKLAVMVVYNQTLKTNQWETDEKMYVPFLRKIFYGYMEDISPIELRKIEKIKSLDSLIQHILFFRLETDVEFTIPANGLNAHKVFNVKKGTYLSFEGCLFVLSMFLYRNEARIIFPKLDHMDKNDDRYKLAIFTFFSKKFSSQDVDNEQQHLVKFRDMMMNLNKFPKHWNRFIKPMPEERDYSQSKEVKEKTDLLHQTVLRMAVEDTYPLVKDRNGFIAYAINHFKGNTQIINKVFDDFLKKNKRFTELFLKTEIPTLIDDIKLTKLLNDYCKWNINGFTMNYIANNFRNDYLCDNDIYQRIKLGQLYDRDSKPELEEEFEQILNDNQAYRRLKKRFENNLLLDGFARNNDKFMDYGMRFLAEQNYFGKEAKFKCYQFTTSEDQFNYVEVVGKKENGKKEKDRLKYQRGRLTRFITYKDHLTEYPEWDRPFVEEANAMLIELQFNKEVGEDGKDKIVRFPIQRKLMKYFLEHALNYSSRGIEKSGYYLLLKYYKKFHTDFTSRFGDLIDGFEIPEGELCQYKKLIPRRLLKNYYTVKPDDAQPTQPKGYEAILREAEFQEKKYELNKNAAKDKKEFIKKNKGKHFKLRFIKRACHVMYFRKVYKNLREEFKDHHSNYHLTMKENEDFSRWMFAFDEVPQYKVLLESLLESKGYLEIEEFKTIFTTSTSIYQFYELVKENFKKWIEANSQKTRIAKYSSHLDRIERSIYAHRNDKKAIVYLNSAHFIAFFKEEVKSRNANEDIAGVDLEIFKSLEHKHHLISEYYVPPVRDEVKNLMNKDMKGYKKLYNLLHQTQLEDCLIYEMAMRYARNGAQQIEETMMLQATTVRNILSHTFKFVHGAESYTLNVPFKQLPRYIELRTMDKQKTEKFGSGLFENLSVYLKGKDHDDGTINKLWSPEQETVSLKLDDFANVYNHIIKSALKYIQAIMYLEAYFVHKDEMVLETDKNRIDQNDLGKLYEEGIRQQRNLALHFALPIESSYQDMIKLLEKKVIAQMLDDELPETFENLAPLVRNVVMHTMKVLYHKEYPKNGKPEEKRLQSREDMLNKWKAIKLNLTNNQA